MALSYSFGQIATCYSLVAMLLLLLPIRIIDYFNRFLFISLLAVVTILLAGLFATIQWSELPLFSEHYTDPSAWASLIPVVFTSFGFQVIFHTLTKYCLKDAKMLKRAFFWGSLIPGIVYVLWTCSILSVVYHDNPPFYSHMATGKAEVGELIQVLSSIAKWQSVQLLVWWISLLAIATSVLGVGVGLCDSLKSMLSKKIPHHGLRNALAAVITVFPAYLVVMFVPNAFITVLGFAGMILAVIAILLPTYLFRQMKAEKLNYPELKYKSLIGLSIAVAVTVIVCEMMNMWR
jgi:tyrosine-specific transport protein